jgi:hypothetical protein
MLCFHTLRKHHLFYHYFSEQLELGSGKGPTLKWTVVSRPLEVPLFFVHLQFAVWRKLLHASHFEQQIPTSAQANRKVGFTLSTKRDRCKGRGWPGVLCIPSPSPLPLLIFIFLSCFLPHWSFYHPVHRAANGFHTPASIPGISWNQSPHLNSEGRVSAWPWSSDLVIGFWGPTILPQELARREGHLCTGGYTPPC